MTVIAVPLLAVVGALLRWQLSRLNGTIPLGTFLVNICASFGAGLLIGSSDTTVIFFTPSAWTCCEINAGVNGPS